MNRVAVVMATGILFTGVVPPASAEEQVTQTLLVTGCDGCTIIADSENPTWETEPERDTRPTAIVVDGQVAFHIAPGSEIWFEIDDPQRQNSWTWTGIVVRYRGKAPGDPVSRKFAKKARAASVYWIVPEMDVTLPVRVDDLGRRWEPLFKRWDRYYRAYLTVTGQNSQPLSRLPKSEHGRYGSNGPS